MKTVLIKPTEEVLLERKKNELNKLIEQKAELSVRIIELQHQAIDLDIERVQVIQQINQLVLELNNGNLLRPNNVV